MGGGDNEVKETAAEKEYARVSIEQWNDYQGPFRDFENKFIADVTGGDNPAAVESARQEMVAGQVNADMAQRAPAVNPLRPLGGKPMDAATTGAAAAVRGEANVRNQRATNLGAVVSMGRGQATDATMGYADLARNSVGEAINDEATKRQESEAVGSAILQGLGGAAAVYKKWKTPTPEEQKQIDLSRLVGNQKVR